MRISTISFIYLVLLGLSAIVLPVASESGVKKHAHHKHHAASDDKNDDTEVEYVYENENAEENVEHLPELEIEDYDVHSFMNAVVMSDYTLVLHLDSTKEAENQKHEQFFEKVKPELFSERPAVLSHLGTIGSDDQEKIPKEFRTDKTPSFIFYDHARPFMYTGELNDDKFVAWLDEIMKREVRTLKTQEELQKFIGDDKETKIVAFYDSEKKNEDELKVLHILLEHNYLARQGIRHVALCPEGCPNTYNGHTFKRPSLVVFRSFDPEQPFATLDKDLKEFTTVNNFVNVESLPPILVFDEINQTRVFDESIPGQIILIVNPESDNKAVLETFAKHSLKNRHENAKEERLLHVEYVYSDETRGLRWLFGNQSLSTLPKLFITEATVELDQILKFEFPQGEKLTIDSIAAFVQKYRNKQLERYYISEDVPTDNEGKAVKRIVGRTYSQEVLRSPETSVVYVCARMDQDLCASKFVKFENVAKRITGLDTNKDANVRFSYIDVAKNEASVNQLEYFPHIMLMKEGQKAEQKVFMPEFTEDELFKWITGWVPKLVPKKVIDRTEL